MAARNRLPTIALPTLAALIATTLLVGMLFGFASVNLIGTRWTPYMTKAFYGVLIVWVGALVYWRRSRLRSLCTIDGLFVAFLLIGSWSVAQQSETAGAAWHYSRFVPFMVLLPYVCGRMMRGTDFVALTKILIISGLTLLPLLAIDRWFGHVVGYDRWPFFGVPHGALLVGGALVISLVAAVSDVCSQCAVGASGASYAMVWRLALIPMLCFVLVLVGARGWLLAGLMGVSATALTTYGLQRRIRLELPLLVLLSICLALVVLPRLSAELSHFYAKVLTVPDTTLSAGHQDFRWNAANFYKERLLVMEASGMTVPLPEDTSFPTGVLGKESCRPFEVGIDSVAMRWVLYQEAIALFLGNFWSGVGAGAFGNFSCVGMLGFPHSTVLQALSELGILGGGVLVSLILLVVIQAIALPGKLTMPEEDRQGLQLLPGLLAVYLLTDQIYGNYFMSVGTYLFAGATAGMTCGYKQGDTDG